MKHKSEQTAVGSEQTSAVSRYDQPWITDGAWITGVIGTVVLLLMGIYFGLQRAHLNGVPWLDLELKQEKYAVMLVTLGVVGACMVIVELIRLARFPGY